jgi:tetratricopeptide (TPR) repeat protein
MKMLIFCMAAGAILSDASALAAESQGQIRCDPKSINRAQFNDDLDGAIASNQACLDERMAELAANENARGGKAQAQINLEEPTVGAHLVAKVELLAERGDLKSAKVALADAQAFDKGHEFAAMRWGMSGAILDVAEAYVLEKSGDTRNALAAYLKVASRLQEQGWSRISNVLFGRIANVQMQLGNKADAQRWAKDAVEVDPGANAAMGLIILQTGDNMGARRYFEKSLDLMTNAARSNGWSLPIFFVELRSVRVLIVQ